MIHPTARAAFVGAGPMGGAILHRLCKQSMAQFQVFDLDTSNYEVSRKYKYSDLPWHIKEDCATHDTFLDCIAGSTILMTCLPNSFVVSQVMEELLDIGPTKIRHWVDFTSGDAMMSKKIASLLETKDIQFVDAAVSGGPDGAAAGTLSVMVGASKQEAFEKMEPFLTAIGTPVHCGFAGSGHAVKAVNNILNMTHLLAAAEGLAALTKFGVNPEKALEAINRGSGASKQTQIRIPEEVLTRKFKYNFQLGLMEKDVRQALKLVQQEYPTAYPSILASTLKANEDATERYGYSADYTEGVRLFEDLTGTKIQSPQTETPI